ncbi:putative PAS/PAC sensor protein [Methanosalsum zhilinae DSM 4017]|uniref:Putative PAS/PAC sensor protein n=1 Tax=Methanosalsum zhilinae (strain DSM 4017 / NBRC 107636 / OCM 62 / WeN5) TaxID=679901 RepID=F7XQK1_METZD|nr:response regulator [Methanosalsum zhilinae]AEH60504.1 putative PAS/PAC sensor protein [Methanosalsum zhilinae DSM 4017]
MNKVKVLVVEDEIIVAHDIKARLEDLGYSVTGVAITGKEAIEKAEDTLPDVILMDIALKGNMDGIEAAETIREKFDIPVIYLTAYSDDKTLERARVTQPFGYLLKPFDEKELRSNIEMTLYRHTREKSRQDESEKWLTTTLDSVGDAVIATDTEGYIKHINPFAEALTGWKRMEATGKHILEVLRLKDKNGQKIEDPVSKAVKEDIFYGLAENTVLISREDEKIPVDIVGSTIKNEKNEIIGIVLNIYDISDRKSVEENIKNESSRKMDD